MNIVKVENVREYNLCLTAFFFLEYSGRVEEGVRGNSREQSSSKFVSGLDTQIIFFYYNNYYIHNLYNNVTYVILWHV